MKHPLLKLEHRSRGTGYLGDPRAIELGGSLPGRVVLFSLAALPLWKAAHHMRHLSIDSGGGDRDAIVGPLMYGVATLGSLLALVAVVRL